MTIDRVKTLLGLMKDNDLTEIEFEESGFRVYLKKKGGDTPQVTLTAPAQPQQAAAGAAPAPVKADSKGAKGPNTITSPIVGTFYRSPSPDAPVFVDVGDIIKPDDVVCIIEAMKVMNSVKAEMSGVVKEILVESAQPVEFGQPLFVVEPL